jgi:hypothetical protein
MPARLAYRVRGAIRRHGELTARAADRGDRQREQVTP